MKIKKEQQPALNIENINLQRLLEQKEETIKTLEARLIEREGEITEYEEIQQKINNCPLESEELQHNNVKLETEKQYLSTDLQFKNELIQHQTEQIKTLLEMQDTIQEQSEATHHQSQLTATYAQKEFTTTKERGKNMAAVLVKKKVTQK